VIEYGFLTHSSADAGKPVKAAESMNEYDPESQRKEIKLSVECTGRVCKPYNLY